MTTRELSRTLLAADSFRVRMRDGQAEVRGLQAHLARFRQAVADSLGGSATVPRSAAVHVAAEHHAIQGGLGESLDAFLADVCASIAAHGEGFPRLELWSVGEGAYEFGLALRPLPRLGDTIEMRTAETYGFGNARRKGPNIERYAALNRELGAEALLVNPGGLVREGATTSIVAWKYEQDTGGLVVEHAARVASITEALLVEAAASRLVGEKPGRSRSGALMPAAISVDLLTRCEVWAVNALHGIRPVTSIDGVELSPPVPKRLAWFREALDRRWEAVALERDAR